jgi:hypothetical protein
LRRTIALIAEVIHGAVAQMLSSSNHGADMQLKMIQKLEVAINQTERLAAVGDGPLLRSCLRELKRYKSMVLNHWPLTQAEKSTIDIARVVSRDFNTIQPEYLTLLSRLTSALRQE